MDMTLDQVRQELADIHDELLALPADDYDRRAELSGRRNELRQLSNQLIQGQPLYDSEILAAAYDRLQRVRDQLLEQHITTSSTSVGDAGIEGEFTSAINKAMDSGIGIDDIEARLKEIIKQMRSSS